MQIEFFGANCIRVKTKKASVVFDDNLSSLGLKSVTSADEVAAVTNESTMGLPAKHSLAITMPGDYEIGDIMITGVPAQSHIDEDKTKNATIFRGIAEDIKFVVLGHIRGALSDEQLEDIGIVDIVFVPVGGAGYTLDGIEAAKLVKELSPKLVVPTHFDRKDVKYEVPQGGYDEFAKVMAIEPEIMDGQSMKLKKSDLSDTTQIKIFK